MSEKEGSRHEIILFYYISCENSINIDQNTENTKDLHYIGYLSLLISMPLGHSDLY